MEQRGSPPSARTEHPDCNDNCFPLNVKLERDRTSTRFSAIELEGIEQVPLWAGGIQVDGETEYWSGSGGAVAWVRVRNQRQGGWLGQAAKAGMF